MNKICFFILFLFCFGFSQARDEDSTVVYDDYYEESYEDSLITGHYKNMYRADSVLIENPVSENTVYPKSFKENIKSRYKGEEFDYSASKPKESFWDKLMRKLFKLIQRIFGETSVESSAQITTVVIRLFAILLVGFLLYFIVKFIIGKNGNFIFGKRNKKVVINDEELHENIHEINFPESIASFERSKDYRSAVRYQFLFVLKKLSDKKLILWNPEKTNKDYVAELKVPNLKNEFSNLSYIFDYVWYGEFSIDEESYVKFKEQYQSFKP
ncbi:hypothetical protein CHRY9390_01023 [Chryseobacterium aquaeductus]|uniref:DUF4129 domain-containing protein n=1 Tax=Chryseobacterium aquaeductus TaxID=2675056 RepID=A0A9N8MF48_9FLAO|nr:DUF4129 domain-containing protein [Chryseobacterium aquaeductus]CAA7330360.1 hypothetical protein CHRY9390_01023 [Chryseobacterium potabilaquae]CAD7803091.1 hypothetical protein CHRY9390_01023 [Chryseobacterium aquaeductus]